MGNEMGNRNINGHQASVVDGTEDPGAASIAANDADGLKCALQGLEKNDFEDSTGKKSPAEAMNLLNDEGGTEVVSYEHREHKQASEQCDIVKDAATNNPSKASILMDNVGNVKNEVENGRDGLKLVRNYLEDGPQFAQQHDAAPMESSILPNEPDDMLQDLSLETLIVYLDEFIEQDMRPAQVDSSGTDENLNQEQATEAREEEEKRTLLPDHQSQTEEMESVLRDKHESTYSKGSESTAEDNGELQIVSEGILAIDVKDDDLENAEIPMLENENPNSSLNSESQMEDLSMEKIESCEDMLLSDKSKDQRCPDSEGEGNALSVSVASASSAYLDAIDFEIQRLLTEDDQNSTVKLGDLSSTECIQEVSEELTMDGVQVDDLDIQLKEENEEKVDDELDDFVLVQNIQTEIKALIGAEHEKQQVGNPSLTSEECNEDSDKEISAKTCSIVADSSSDIKRENSMDSARDVSDNDISILETHDTSGKIMSAFPETELETDGPPRTTATLSLPQSEPSDLDYILIQQHDSLCSFLELEQKHSAVESEIVGNIEELSIESDQDTFSLLNASIPIIEREKQLENQTFENSAMWSQDKEQQCELERHAAVNVSSGDLCEVERCKHDILEPTSEKSDEMTETVKPIALLNLTTSAEGLFHSFETCNLEAQETLQPNIAESEATIAKSEQEMNNPYANDLKTREGDSSVLEFFAPDTDSYAQETLQPIIAESEATIAKSEQEMNDPYANHLKTGEGNSSVLEICAPENDSHAQESLQPNISESEVSIAKSEQEMNDPYAQETLQSHIANDLKTGEGDSSVLELCAPENDSYAQAKSEQEMNERYANDRKTEESDSSVLEICVPEADKSILEKTEEVSSKVGVETSLPLLESNNEESEKSPLLHQKQLKEQRLSSKPEGSNSGKLRSPLFSLMKEEVYALESWEKEGLHLKKSVEEAWRSPEKKFMPSSPQKKEKQKPKSSLFSNCMCCTTAVIN